MTKFIVACLFLFNIISIFGLEASLQEECNSVNKFLNDYVTNSGSSLRISECCKEGIICQDGHIVQYKISPETNESIDFSLFPALPNIKSLVIEGPVLKDNVIPPNLFTIPSLQYLNVTHAGAKIPSIPDNCSIEYLDLYKNNFNGFPSTVTHCKNLKLLNLSHNSLVRVPGDIANLQNLEYLYIGATELTSLSEKVFTLKLKEFDLGSNPELSTKILNFATQVEMCDLRETKIICYESNTCKTLVKSESPVHELYPDAESVYPNKCNGSAIGSNNTLTYIIISILFAIIVILCIVFFVSKRKSKKKAKNELKADIVVSPLITVTPTELNNLKVGDNKIVPLTKNNMLLGDGKKLIPGDRNSVLLGDPSMLPTLKLYNETVKDADITISENHALTDLQELQKKNTNSFENLNNLMKNDIELPAKPAKIASSPSTSNKKIAPSLSISSYNEDVKLSPSPTSPNQLVSPSNSHKSENLSPSNSRGNRHSIVPLVLSSEQGQNKPSAKALEALQNSLENSNEGGLSPSNSASGNRHSTIPLVLSSEQGQLKPSAKALEALQNSLENSGEYGVSSSNVASGSGHSTIPLVVSSEQNGFRPNAKAVEAQQNQLENTFNTIEPPPSYVIDDKQKLPSSSNSIHSSSSKEEMNEQIESNIYSAPVIIDDRSPIGEIKKTYTLPPYSAIPFISKFDDEEKELKDKEDK